jgi:hypothetical protein
VVIFGRIDLPRPDGSNPVSIEGIQEAVYYWDFFAETGSQLLWESSMMDRDSTTTTMEIMPEEGNGSKIAFVSDWQSVRQSQG